MSERSSILCGCLSTSARTPSVNTAKYYFSGHEVKFLENNSEVDYAVFVASMSVGSLYCNLKDDLIRARGSKGKEIT